MDPPLDARRLRWADVSPGEHAFDPASSGLALHVAEPVFLLARPSAAPHGAWWLAYLLAHVVGDRAER